MRSRSTPFWLRSLLALQRSCSGITLGLVAATLAVYGSTVYLQQQWNRDYRQLQILRQHERQLTVATESLKHNIAEQLKQPQTDLQPQHDRFIVLSPSDRRAETPVEMPTQEISSPIDRPPLGY